MSVDQAISDHIVLALRDLEAGGMPLMGKRNITLFLQGKVNANSLQLNLHLRPAWGSLAFISVRKLQLILEGMVVVGLIEVLESPRKGLPVLRAARTPPTEPFSLGTVFPLNTDLIVSGLDLDLFRLLRKERTEISESTGYFPTKLLSDELLVKIAQNRPKNKDELREIIGTNRIRLWSEYKRYIRVIESFENSQ
jgi:superfamily II DNA helicase RecQ